MKARAPSTSFLKSYSGWRSVYKFAKKVHFLSSVTAFAELTYNQYRNHCELQTTESELTWNIHNYVCSAVISRDAGAAVG